MRVLLCVLMACLLGCVRSESLTDDRQQELAADENVQLGLSYLAHHNMDAAKSHLLLALDEMPSSVMALTAMGYYNEVTGDLSSARQYYDLAIHQAPASGVANNNRGAFLCRQGFYLEAIEAFKQAALDDHYTHAAKAYENAGICALMIPDKVQAQLLFRQAFNRDSTTAVALIELAALELELGHEKAAKIKLNTFLSVHSPTALSKQLGEALQ